jgi:DNA-binding PadR family transcriptional regulator
MVISIYPILLRLEGAGWLGSRRWKKQDPRMLRRPWRRLYRVTALGVRKARAAFKEMQSAIGEFAWT